MSRFFSLWVHIKPLEARLHALRTTMIVKKQLPARTKSHRYDEPEEAFIRFIKEIPIEPKKKANKTGTATKLAEVEYRPTILTHNVEHKPMPLRKYMTPMIRLK